MKIPNDKEKYTSSWRYVEVAKYVKSLSKVIRDKQGTDSVLIDIDEVDSYAEKNNNIRNIHINMALRFKGH